MMEMDMGDDNKHELSSSEEYLMDTKDLPENAQVDTGKKQHRRAFRVEPPGTISIRVNSSDKKYAVKDISFLGAAFVDENYSTFHIGQKIKIDVVLKGYIFLQGVSADVVRIIEHEKCVACTFPELTASDEMRLTKLVLEIQKEYIRRTTKVL